MADGQQQGGPDGRPSGEERSGAKPGRRRRRRGRSGASGNAGAAGAAGSNGGNGGSKSSDASAKGGGARGGQAGGKGKGGGQAGGKGKGGGQGKGGGKGRGGQGQGRSSQGRPPRGKPEDAQLALGLRLQKVLARLPKTQRDVLEYRMGLRDGHPHNLADTARELGMSLSEARDVEQRAFAHIRDAVPIEHLQKFLDTK